MSALNSFAQSAGNYSSIGDLINDVIQNDVIIDASQFKGKTITLGRVSGTGESLEWAPVYISRTTVEGEEQAILTLWLAQSVDKSTFSIIDTNTSVSPWNSMYSSSYIHAKINNGKTSTGYFWTDVGTVSQNSSESEITDYTTFIEFTAGGIFDDYILAPQYVGWQMEENYAINDPLNTTFAAQNGENYKYLGWTEDNLWLPSLTEIGATTVNPLWNTDATIRADRNLTWSRSATPGFWAQAYYYGSDGNCIGTSSNGTGVAYGVRPAIHINLNSFGYSVSDVTVNYNGEEQILDSNAGWYISESMIANYLQAPMVNVGSYKVEVSLTPETIAQGVTWAGGTTDTKQIIFTIKKKPVAVKFTYNEEGIPIGVDWTDMDAFYERDSGNIPKLGIMYISTCGETLDDPYKVPWEVGSYQAVAYVVDADKHSYSYEVDTSTATSEVFTLEEQRVPEPEVEGGGTAVTVPYDGSKQTFTLQYITADVEYKLGDGLNVESYDGETGTLIVSAAEIGSYTVTVSLADADNTLWASGGTDDKTITITIEKAPEPVNPDPDNPGGGSGTTDPTDPDNPGGSGTTDPTDPNNPGGGGTTDPTDPNNPGGGGTTDPTDPDNPGGGSGTTDPDNPDGSGTTDPTDPDNPGGSGTTDPTDPDNPDGSGTTDPDGNTDGNTESDNNNGFAAVWNNVKNAMTKQVAGLAIWIWVLIALAVLLFLIIIIAVASKRRKSKDEREEIKARKEEERQRRDEERRLQKEKLDAERELAKAKQEAELEKIRMQAGLAGAGMASMAMQQPQPQPQQMPQPIIQQVPDNSAIMRLEAELAEMRAKLANAQQSGAPVQAANFDGAAMLRLEAELAELRAKQSGASAAQPVQQVYDGGAMARIEAELSALREEQKSRTEAELANAKLLVEFERLRGDVRQLGGAVNFGGQQNSVHNTAIPADVVIALLEAVKNGNAPVSLTGAPAAIPQIVEESPSQPVMAQYPSDAVITTTTTVDRTKPLRESKRDKRAKSGSDFTDVDGFYDEI